MKKEISPGLCFFGDAVCADLKLDELSFFFKEIESFSQQSANNFRNLLSSGKLHPLHLDNFYSDHDYETLGDISRESFIIMLVKFVETEIKSYCENFIEYNNINLKFNDFKGSVLERFLLVMNKLLLLDFKILDCELHDIKGVFEVRNCLVHSDGYLEMFPKRKLIESFINQHKLNCINTDADALIITNETCNICFGIIKKFVNTIYDFALEKHPEY